MVGVLPSSSEMVKLQLYRPDRSTNSSSPTIVSSPFLTSVQRTKLHSKVVDENRDLVALPSPEPARTTATLPEQALDR